MRINSVYLLGYNGPASCFLSISKIMQLGGFVTLNWNRNKGVNVCVVPCDGLVFNHRIPSGSTTTLTGIKFSLKMN